MFIKVPTRDLQNPERGAPGLCVQRVAMWMHNGWTTGEVHPGGGAESDRQAARRS